jgi:hypothetical protein
MCQKTVFAFPIDRYYSEMLFEFKLPHFTQKLSLWNGSNCYFKNVSRDGRAGFSFNYNDINQRYK